MPHRDTSSGTVESPDQSTNHEYVWNRRTYLAAVGAISFGSLTATATAQADVAPETYEEFQEAVEETVNTADSVIDGGPFEPTWDSLSAVDPVPEWFRDGKFGIFFHWGPYAVPAFGHEWYPRQMYNTGNWINEYHTETYGDPAEAPYQDFVPDFTAEEFDASEWADLFEEAGAAYAGPVIEHHDGYSLWDSDITPWNAGETGPERDLAGELVSAIRDEDLRFVTTFHHSYNLIGPEGYFSTAYENYPSVTEGYPDRIMYGNLPDDLAMDTWLAKLVEAVEGYGPDFIWFDWGLPDIPDAYKQRFLAYMYNTAAAEDRDVVVTNKREALPANVSVEDYELGRPRSIQERPWNAEFKVAETGGWGFVEDREFYSAEYLVHTLVDAVSKNGQLLLSIGPRADGTIEDAERERLLAIGDWLETNGDAIYGTRPWDAFGEGPTRLEEGGEFTEDIEYTAEDIRYTRSKDGETLYAIVLGWPGAGSLTFEATSVDHVAGPPQRAGPPDHANARDHAGPPSHAGAAEVRLLGYGPVEYRVTDADHLEVTVPDLSEDERPSDVAIAFAIEKFEISPTDAAHR